MMIDYTIYYKTELSVDWETDHTWDIFISAFNSSERVVHVFNKIKSVEKYWLIFPEYNYTPGEYPSGNVFAGMPGDENEADFVKSFFKGLSNDLSKCNICIDITGFIRPYIIFLVRWLQIIQINKFDVLYSEPRHYYLRDETKFSDEYEEVRDVKGLEGSPNLLDTSNDILIIGAGYETELIARVAKKKENAKKIQVFGLPSLRADMYQENVIKAHDASEAVGIGASGHEPNNYFAPAHDPFVYAKVLKDIVDAENRKKTITNLYLCPLATKPQVLGFTLYYITEWINKNCSIIFPFCLSYSRKTSTGVSRIWKYTVELI